MPSVYLDTNAVIRLVEEGHDGLRMLFEQRTNDDLQLVTSELTLAEVLVGPAQTGSTRLAQVYEALLADPILIQTIAVDRPILRKSAQMRAAFGGKLPDAIHVATAVLSGCSVVLSSDRRLRMPINLRRIDVEDVDRLDEWL